MVKTIQVPNNKAAAAKAPIKAAIKVAVKAPVKAAPAKAVASGCKKPGCKWCAKGECWGSGKPPAGKPAAGKPATKPATNKPAQNAGKKQGGVDTQAMMKMLKGGSGNDLQIMQALMTMMGMDDSGDAGSSGGQELQHKQLLNQAHSKALGKPIKKGEDLTYEVDEVGTGDDRYQATVTVSEQEYAGECARSHRHAEDSAALIALKDLYPDALKQGVKRKGAPVAAAEVNAKMQLNQAIQIIKGPGVLASKEDAVYTTEDAPNGGFKATLVLKAVNNLKFTGSGASKKEAETAAAAAALKHGQFKSKLNAAEAKKAAAKEAAKKAK